MTVPGPQQRGKSFESVNQKAVRNSRHVARNVAFPTGCPPLWGSRIYNIFRFGPFRLTLCEDGDLNRMA